MLVVVWLLVTVFSLLVDLVDVLLVDVLLLLNGHFLLFLVK